MRYVRKKVIIIAFFLLLTFFTTYGEGPNIVQGNPVNEKDLIKDGTFNLEEFSHEEVAKYCNSKNCSSPGLLEGLEDEDRGKIAAGVSNYENIPEQELIRPPNRGYINVTEPEFIAYYNYADFSFQENVYFNFSDYKGKLDRDFFCSVYTDKNLERFDDQYDLDFDSDEGIIEDILDYIDDLTDMIGDSADIFFNSLEDWDERKAAVEAYFDIGDSFGGYYSNHDDLLAALNERGYYFDEFYIHESLEVSFYDDHLIVPPSTIELESLDKVSSLKMYEDNTIKMDEIEIINANSVSFEDGFQTKHAEFVKTPSYKVHKPYEFKETEEKIAITSAEEFSFGDTATSSYNYQFINLDEAFFEKEDDSLISGSFTSNKDESTNIIREAGVNTNIDAGCKLEFSRKDKSYNLSFSSEKVNNFLFGNVTEEEYIHFLENFSTARFSIDDKTLCSGSFISVENETKNIFEKGGMNITIDAEDFVNFTKSDDERYNISLDSQDANVTDKDLYVRYIEIPPGSRYSYMGEEYEQFSIFIPSHGDLFKLYLKESEDEDFDLPSNNFGLFDFISHSAEMEGIFQYEKKPSEFPLFRNAINAIESCECNFSFDEQMNIANLTFNSDEVYINSGRIEAFSEDTYTYSLTEFEYADSFRKIGDSRRFFENKFLRDTESKIILYSKESTEGSNRLNELEEWFEWLG